MTVVIAGTLGMALALLHFLAWAAAELALFAGVGFLIFAVDEMLVDILWLARAIWRKLVIFRHRDVATAETLGHSATPGRLAIFVPAWDESAVIAHMLSHARINYGDAEFDIFVGCYPNDPETIGAVDRLGGSGIIRIVCDRAGPTTKGHCLNELWKGLQAHQLKLSVRYKGVILHDAEDVVAVDELSVVDWMLDRFDFVQLPVVPLPDRGSRLVSGHYCDEFAESHGKTLIVREWLGAAIPAAGVGCAIALAALSRLAEENDGEPFGTTSLTEDYELGLALHAKGWRTAFVRLPSSASPGIVATQAHFPTTISASVRQKTRWMIGIALAGWDRLGWDRGWGENWMRWRDRRAILAAVLVCIGYLALVLALVAAALAAVLGVPLEWESATLQVLLSVNLGFLVWRILGRAFFVWRIYGIREAGLSVVRLPIANFILILAARRAVVQYWRMMRGAPLVWDKTAHQFPSNAGQRL